MVMALLALVQSVGYSTPLRAEYYPQFPNLMLFSFMLQSSRECVGCDACILHATLVYFMQQDVGCPVMLDSRLFSHSNTFQLALCAVWAIL